MRRLLALIAALILPVAGTLTPAGAQDATPTAGPVTPLGPTRTTIHYFLPFSGDGLNGELTVRANERGACDHESLASPGRPDAWGCVSVDNAVYDPCFQNPFSTRDQPGALACVASPFAREVVLLTPTQPLPVAKDTAGGGPPASGPKGTVSNGAMAPPIASGELSEPLPWALELADGEQCTLATGATAAVAGMRINYFCSGGGSLLGEPDRTLPVWAINSVPDGGLVTDLVEVRAAWL